jgi:hypothetical protein
MMGAAMSEQLIDLAAVYGTGGELSVVYADVSADVTDPERTLAIRRKDVGEALARLGAPDDDLAAVERILQLPTGIQSPASRFIVVRNGNVSVNEVFSGALLAPESVSFGLVPDITPLLLHRPYDFCYLIVEVGRDGGEIRLFSMGRPHAEDTENIEGETEHLHKVRTGGWSDIDYQHHTEEIWKQNEAEIAARVDALVLEFRPRLLIVTGDVRAVQLLVKQLSKASRQILSTATTNTRPPDSSDRALIDLIDVDVATVLAHEEDDALDRLRAGTKAGTSVAGITEAVKALQSGQVETLLLSTSSLEESTLLALSGEPWLAMLEADAPGTGVLATVAAQSALVRAAILTGARIIFVSAAELPDEALVAAVLRWPLSDARDR